VSSVFSGWAQNKAKNEDLVDTAIDVGEWAWENQDAIIDTVSSIFSGWCQTHGKTKNSDWVDTAVDVGEWAWDN